jgi:hypothetical protein
MSSILVAFFRPYFSDSMLGPEPGLLKTRLTHIAANGFQALFSNTTGVQNTAIGLEALFSNTTGDSNTAVGQASLYSNTTGIYNTAVGFGTRCVWQGLTKRWSRPRAAVLFSFA